VGLVDTELVVEETAAVGVDVAAVEEDAGKLVVVVV
jgi:hypothetical protein